MEDWQKQLEGFKKDPEAAKKELLRAKSVYEAEQAKGAGNDRLTQISTWANQVRGAAGISNDDADFGVNSTAQRVKELLQGTQKPAGGFKPSGHNLRPTTPKPSVTTAAAPTVTTPTTPTATPTTTAAPSFEQKGTSLINTMYDPTEVLQRIKKQRDIQQQGLNNQERMANENASSSLNQNDVNYHTDVSRLRELMAASGLGQSGDSVTAMVGANTARQQGANQINMDRARMLQNIMEQRSLIDNNAAADEAAALAGNNSQRAAQLLQLMRDTDDRTFRDNQFGWQQGEADRNRAIQIGQLMGTYGGNQTLQARMADQDVALRVGQLMGNYNGSPTLQKQAQDSDIALRVGQLMGNYNGQQTFQSKQADIQNNQWQQGFDRGAFESDRGYNYQVGRDQVGDQQWDKTFNRQISRDAVSDSQWQQGFDREGVWRDQDLVQRDWDNNFRATTHRDDNTYRNSQLGLQAQSNSLAQQRFNTENDPNSLDNQIKQKQLEQMGQAKPANIGDNIDTLNKMYTSKDPMSGDLVVKDTYGLRQAIIGMGYSDEDTIKLLNYYRLPIQPTTYGGGR